MRYTLLRNHQSSAGWLTRTSSSILHFHVWNTDPLNIPKPQLTAPWHRTSVLAHIDKLPMPKASYSIPHLRDQYLHYIDGILHPSGRSPPLAIYCDASVGSFGAAGIGLLIPDINHEESLRISDWASTTDAEGIAIYHALQVGSGQNRPLAVFSDSQGALLRLCASDTEHLVTCNILQLTAHLSTHGISVTFHWIPSHIGISFCDKVDQLAKSALLLEEPHYGLPLSLMQLKHRIVSSLQDYDNQTWTAAKLHGSATIQHYEGVVGLSDEAGRYKLYNSLTRRQQATLTRLRIGYKYTTHFVKDAVLDTKPLTYNCCKLCKAPNSHNLEHYLLECVKTAPYRSISETHRPSLIDYIKCIIETGLVYDMVNDIDGFLPTR